MNNYNIIPLEQGSQEWLDFRKGKVGASDAAAIMGISPWETELQCWERIVYEKSKPKNRYMKRGSELENSARELINKKTGRDYRPIVLQSVFHPNIIASLDGYWISEEGEVYILEIKCPGSKDQKIALEGKIPEHYYPQIVHQQDLSQSDHTLYASWDGVSEDIVMIEYKRDEKYASKLFSKILEFLSSMVEYTPPKATIKDWNEVHDIMAAERAKEYIEISEHIKILESKKKNIRQELIELCNESSSLIKGMDGSQFKLEKIIKKGPVDYDKILQDYGVDSVEKYRKSSIECWMLTK